jgi:hypothetical protein
VEAHTLLAHIPRNRFGVEGTPSQASVLPHRHCLQIYSKTPVFTLLEETKELAK